MNPLCTTSNTVFQGLCHLADYNVWASIFNGHFFLCRMRRVRAGRSVALSGTQVSKNQRQTSWDPQLTGRNWHGNKWILTPCRYGARWGVTNWWLVQDPLWQAPDLLMEKLKKWMLCTKAIPLYFILGWIGSVCSLIFIFFSIKRDIHFIRQGLCVRKKTLKWLNLDGPILKELQFL